MAVVAKLNRGETTEIPGILLDNHTFMGAVSVITLKRIVLDPLKIEDKRMRQVDPELQQAYELRQLAQRVMESGKLKNVPVYAKYIEGLHDGEDGAVPAIHLWVQQDLPVLVNLTEWGADSDGRGGHAVLGIPADTLAMAIDGDTQLAARFQAHAHNNETGSDRVPLIVHFNHNVRWAQNSFHDLNVLRVNVNAAISIGMDNREPFTVIAKYLQLECQSLKERVNTTARSLKKKDPAIITLPALRHFVLGVAFGSRGQAYGNKPVPPSDYKQSDLKSIEKTAKLWWEIFFNELEDIFEDRENAVTSSLPAIIAIGSLGNELLKLPTEQQQRHEAERLALDLAQVDWKKGKRWDGILGGVAPDKDGVPRFQIRDQGASRIATYLALTDRNSDAYKRIRPKYDQDEAAAPVPELARS